MYERLRAFLGTKLFREVAITYTGQLLGSGIGFLLQILLQGQLGPDDYGVLGLAGSVGQLTGVLTDIGLSHAMIRFASPHVSEGRPEQAMTRFAGALLVRFLLACVVAGVGFASASAIAVGVFAFAAAQRRSRSWSGDRMDIPANRVIDARLIVGGVLFGAGWGIGGFCPGPALVAMSSGLGSAAVFVIAMLAGMVLHDRFLQPR